MENPKKPVSQTPPDDRQIDQSRPDGKEAFDELLQRAVKGPMVAKIPDDDNGPAHILTQEEYDELKNTDRK